ncbi:PAS and ANTAR domain-containing protein [Streptomyces sp. MBT53]|uniref:PAS and ANTAR domain-containing protein n=1 Tax=Streptomyces sp. MBT53 TaxID=1488384 RepID=UPI001F3ED9E2|nr:PAS and ANTAR domain-containing protein [Streptomyces sp. MBT53]
MVPEDGRADDVTGVFLHRLPEDTWWWSDEMFRLLGHEPDAVTPTAGLLRERVHIEDRARLDSALEHGRTTGHPFSCYLRVVGAQDAERNVVLVGDGRTGDDGDVVVLRGFAVDVTAPVRQEARRAADSDIDRARVSQVDVDLARGVLMALYGIDADIAMRVLRRHSQYANMKLRTLAQSVREAAPTAPGRPQHDLHQRVSAVLYPDRE